MTSTTDKAEHPDVAEISDLAEGLLPLSRTADLRRHLDACELCADVYASLEEIRVLLGTVPGATRMPAEVADRIDAALAAEALLNPSPSQSVQPPALVNSSRSGADEAAEDAEDAEAHVSRETSPLADRPAGHSHSATGPGRKERKRGGRRPTVMLGAVFTAAVLGAGTLFLHSLAHHTSSDPAAHGKPTSATDTFAKGQLESQVADLLSTEEPSQSSSGSEQPWNAESEPDGSDSGTKHPQTLIQPSASIPPCIRQGINRGNDDVLGAKQGTYNGVAAYLVVFPDASDSSRVTAYVVDSSCVSGQTATPGKVLLKQSYAHP